MLTPREIVRGLKACCYRYNNKKDLGNKIHYGFLAQDILKAFGDEYAFVKKDANGEYYQVDYMEFIAPLVSVVNSQQDQIDELMRLVKNDKV